MQTLEANMKEKVQEAWSKKPLIIGGPCSAETEDQLVSTAQRLAATGKINMLRAGIWKPRTRPGEFEGIGSIVEFGFIIICHSDQKIAWTYPF
mgnify:CR=1 FL=1